MVARAAQNANYRLGQVTGWVGGAEAMGRGLYLGGHSESGRVWFVGAEPMRAPEAEDLGLGNHGFRTRSRGYSSLVEGQHNMAS